MSHHPLDQESVCSLLQTQCLFKAIASYLQISTFLKKNPQAQYSCMHIKKPYFKYLRKSFPISCNVRKWYFQSQSAKLSSNGINYPSHEKKVLATWHPKKQKQNFKYDFDMFFKLKIRLHNNNYCLYTIFIPRQVAVTQNVNSHLLKTLILFCILFPLEMTLQKMYFFE